MISSGEGGPRRVRLLMATVVARGENDGGDDEVEEDEERGRGEEGAYRLPRVNHPLLFRFSVLVKATKTKQKQKQREDFDGWMDGRKELEIEEVRTER